MKNGIMITSAALLITAMLSGCGGSTSDTSATTASAGSAAAADTTTTEPAAPDLTGEWKQVNSSSETSYQAATISGDTIEIYWVSEDDDTRSLYWSGSFEAPDSADEPYTWESQNNHDATDSALLASSDDTKTFTYEDEQISYEATALGTTATIQLEKQSELTADSTDAADTSADASEGALAQYNVQIVGAKTCTDWEGNPAIMITYSWTNGSEETTSPMACMYEKAFQDGVQLETAIVDFEYNDGLTDVRPGTTIEVDVIYEMPGTSTVEFEVSAIEDMFLSDVPMVTAEFDPASLASAQ